MTGPEFLAAYASGRRDFSRADLSRADLRGADLSGANLRRASLYCADLSGADLSDASLCCANLRGANLRGASLYCADLSDASLRDANLRSANLRSANLSACLGLVWASVGFASHGERGRALLGVVVDGADVYFCGCFRGSLDELRAYIREGAPQLAESRELAAVCCSGLLEHAKRAARAL